MTPLLTFGAGLLKDWYAGRQKVKQAKIEREVQALTNESDWDKVQADASKNSWKDEWFTLILTIPLVLCFFPSMQEVVLEGFKVLDECPDWYKGALGVAIAASFGVKAYSNRMK